MEQTIRCSNNPDKNAVRLCDDCGKPFCAGCLRKNPLGFYYCQQCYPALFKDTSAQAYDIPVDEELLRKMQRQINTSLEKPTLVGSIQYIKRGIGIGVLLLFLFLIPLISYLSRNPSVVILSLTGMIYVYYLAGKYCGRRWQSPSGGWGLWLTIPLVGVLALLYRQVTNIKAGNEGQIIGGLIFYGCVILYFILLLVSSYGGYIGSREARMGGGKDRE